LKQAVDGMNTEK